MFILSAGAMIDKFRKLVAVAEDMAAKWNEMGENVEGVVVDVEGDFGVVRIGVFGIVNSSYFPDENVVMPEYGVKYYGEPFNWDGNDWREALPQVIVNDVECEMIEDELPF